MADVRLQPSAFEDIEDTALAALDEELAEEEAIQGFMGKEGTAVDFDGDLDDCPFELGLAQPRALCLLRLLKSTGQRVSASITAALGHSRRPVLFVHEITPFSRFGYPPTRVWGLGYQIANVPDSLSPVDFVPKSEFLEIGSVGTDVQLGFSADGKFAIDAALADAVRALPGAGIEGLGYTAKAEGHIGFALNLRIHVLKIQAGLVGRGVRWDFVEQDERIDRSVRMLQTALLPDGVDSIEMDVRAWVRRRRRFLGFGAARSWVFSPQTMSVDIEK